MTLKGRQRRREPPESGKLAWRLSRDVSLGVGEEGTLEVLQSMTDSTEEPGIDRVGR